MKTHFLDDSSISGGSKLNPKIHSLICHRPSANALGCKLSAFKKSENT